LFSMDTPAAYRLLADRERAMEVLGVGNSTEETERPRLKYELALRAVMNKIPANWLHDGRLVPPRREEEMDF